MKISIAAIVLLALMGSSDAASHSEALATPYQSQVRRLPPAYDYLVQLGLGEFTEQISPAIIGGSPADIANFPYQLNLRHAGSFQCGASIISSLWALTAAHCVDNGIPANLVSFRAGSADRSAGGTIYTADLYILHPEYNPNSFFMDVAVVRVTTPFGGPNIATVPLAPVNLNTHVGSRAVVSGWGLNDNGIYPMQLLYVDIPIVSQASCTAVWGNLITAEMICAGEFGRDSCNGDSGGPMVSGGLQIGIVSWGATNCGGNAPGVYASVSHPSVRSFITQHTGV